MIRFCFRRISIHSQINNEAAQFTNSHANWTCIENWLNCNGSIESRSSSKSNNKINGEFIACNSVFLSLTSIVTINWISLKLIYSAKKIATYFRINFWLFIEEFDLSQWLILKIITVMVHHLFPNYLNSHYASYICNNDIDTSLMNSSLWNKWTGSHLHVC